MHIPNVPTVDALEPRLLLSQTVSPLLLTMSADSVIVAAKKSKDEGEKSKGKGHVKAKKSPEIMVLLNNSSIANGVATVDFGTVTVGNGAPVRTFQIHNDGKGSLAIGSISLPAGFSLLDAPAGRLGRGDTTSFTVRMDSGSVATRGGRLTFSNNDADEGAFSIGLKGRVVAKVVTPPPPPPVTPPAPGKPGVTVWRVRGTRSALAVADGSSAAVEFGAVAVGARVPSQTFRVANEGTATLSLGAVQLPAGFRLVGSLSATLAPGAMDEFTVAMDTGTAGVRSGEIRFSTNDARASVFNFSIRGAVATSAPTTPTPPPAKAPTPGVQGTTLIVNGTAGDDVIVVGGKSSAISVTINGRLMTGSPFAGVTKVIVNAGDGNDSVTLSRLFINATANGGFGDDTLIGTAADDVLNGEAGNDSLEGGAGNDNLLGGDGNDTLTGGAGVDVFHGEGGNDVLNAIDGIGDAVLDGGGGADVVHRDRVDPAAS
ncbi:MAG: Ca2+-binding protein toxin-related [Phycisphaerales bacterium]|nr:Ca2+-binding protein toxin-related [Phycisphaerales bacterium]